MAFAGYSRLDDAVMEDQQILPASEPAAAPAQVPANMLRRILVVDDDLAILRLGSAVLIQSGYQVDVAEDGAAGWQALSTDRYDLLITDQNMPNVTGLELIEKLHGAHMSVPVIMATGTVPADEFERSPWLRPAAMLVKPYSVERLLAAVKEILCAPTAAEGPQNQSPCAQ